MKLTLVEPFQARPATEEVASDKITEEGGFRPIRLEKVSTNLSHDPQTDEEAMSKKAQIMDVIAFIKKVRTKHLNQQTTKSRQKALSKYEKVKDCLYNLDLLGNRVDRKV